MVATWTSTSRLGRASHLIRRRPGAAVVRLLPFAIAVQVLIDFALGEKAEYYDAFGLVEAWWQVVTSGGVDAGNTFIIGQDRLGQPAALAVGTVLLVAQPAIVLAIVVFGVHQFLRRSGRPVERG